MWIFLLLLLLIIIILSNFGVLTLPKFGAEKITREIRLNKLGKENILTNIKCTGYKIGNLILVRDRRAKMFLTRLKNVMIDTNLREERVFTDDKMDRKRAKIQRKRQRLNVVRQGAQIIQNRLNKAHANIVNFRADRANLRNAVQQRNNQIQALNNQVAQLQQDVQNRNNHIQQLQNQLHQLQQQAIQDNNLIANLNLQINQAAGDIQNRDNQIQQLQQQIQQLQQQAQQDNNNLQQLNNDLLGMTQQRDAANQTVQQRDNQIQQLQQQIQQLQQAAQQANNQIQQLNNDLLGMTQQRDAANQTVQQRDAQIQQLNNDLLGMTQQRDAANQTVQQRDAQIQQLQQAAQQDNNQIQLLTQQRNAADQTVQQRDAQIQQLNNDLLGMTQQRDAANQTVQQLQQQIAQLQQDLQQSQQQTQQANVQIQQLNNDVQTLTQQRDAAVQTVHQRDAQIIQLTNDLRQARDDIRNKELQLENGKQLLLEFNAKEEQSTRETLQARARIEELQTKLKNAKSDNAMFEFITGELTKAKKEQKKTIDRLTNELQMHITKNAQLETQIRNLTLDLNDETSRKLRAENQVRDLNLDLTTEKDQKNQLELRLKEKNDETTKLEEDVKRMTKIADGLNADAKKLKKELNDMLMQKNIDEMQNTEVANRLNRRINELETMITNLQQEKTQQNNDLDRLIEKIEVENRKISETQQNVARQHNKIRNLKMEIAQLKTTRQLLTTTINEKDETIRQLNKQISSLAEISKKKIDNLNRQLEQQTNLKERALREINELNNRLQQAEDQFNNIREQMKTEMLNAHTQLTNTIKSLEEQKLRKDNEINEYIQNTIRDLQTEKNNALREMQANYNNIIDEQNQKIENLTNKIKEFEKETPLSKQKIIYLKEQKDVLIKETLDLKNTIDDLNIRILKNKELYEKSIAEKNNAIDFHKNVTEVSKKISEAKIRALGREITNLKQENDILNDKIKNPEKSNTANFKEELINFYKKATETAKRMSEIQIRSLDRDISELKRSEEEKNLTIKKLITRNEELLEIIRKLEDQIMMQNMQIARVTKERDDCEEERARLRIRVANLEQLNEQIKTENTNLDEDNKKLQEIISGFNNNNKLSDQRIIILNLTQKIEMLEKEIEKFEEAKITVSQINTPIENTKNTEELLTKIKKLELENTELQLEKMSAVEQVKKQLRNALIDIVTHNPPDEKLIQRISEPEKQFILNILKTNLDILKTFSIKDKNYEQLIDKIENKIADKVPSMDFLQKHLINLDKFLSKFSAALNYKYDSILPVFELDPEMQMNAINEYFERKPWKNIHKQLVNFKHMIGIKMEAFGKIFEDKIMQLNDQLALQKEHNDKLELAYSYYTNVTEEMIEDLRPEPRSPEFNVRIKVDNIKNTINQMELEYKDILNNPEYKNDERVLKYEAAKELLKYTILRNKYDNKKDRLFEIKNWKNYSVKEIAEKIKQDKQKALTYGGVDDTFWEYLEDKPIKTAMELQMLQGKNLHPFPQRIIPLIYNLKHQKLTAYITERQYQIIRAFYNIQEVQTEISIVANIPMSKDYGLLYRVPKALNILQKIQQDLQEFDQQVETNVTVFSLLDQNVNLGVYRRLNIVYVPNGDFQNRARTVFADANSASITIADDLYYKYMKQVGKYKTKPYY